jgi:hypothetical protein
MLPALIMGLVVQDMVAGSPISEECKRAMHTLLVQAAP